MVKTLQGSGIERHGERDHHAGQPQQKWANQPALDENGQQIISKNSKPILRPSYSILQDKFYEAMRNAGYHDVERNQRGSTEEHLTVTQFKVQQEQQRLTKIQDAQVAVSTEIAQLDADKAQAEKDVRKAEARLEHLTPQVDTLQGRIHAARNIEPGIFPEIHRKMTAIKR